MKKLTGIAVLTTAEGKRVSYTYSEIDAEGNVTSPNNKGSFVALEEEALAAISALEQTAQARLEE